jgi:hypothetical protein
VNVLEPNIVWDAESAETPRRDWPTAKKQSSLGNDEPYASFLAYFDKKLTDMPLQEFLQRFVFGQSDLAQEMFLRLFHGVLHPLISFGFGVEFQQSAVMSEGWHKATATVTISFTRRARSYRRCCHVAGQGS